MGRRKRQQKKKDEEEKLNTMAETAAAFGAYRPHQQAAYNEGLDQTLATFQGSNDMLAGMFGGNSAATSSGPEGNLVSPEMMAVGQTSQSPGFADAVPEGYGSRYGAPGEIEPIVNDQGEPINSAAPAVDYYGNPLPEGQVSPGGETRRTLY